MISPSQCQIKTIKLEDNAALHRYLGALADRLDARSRPSLAAVLRSAKQATGLSTEFLGESLIALRNVLEGENGALTSVERDHLVSVIRQVEFYN